MKRIRLCQLPRILQLKFIESFIHAYTPSRLSNRAHAAGAHAFAQQADVSDQSEIVAMFETARDEFGSVDILVNNAGLQVDAFLRQMTRARLRLCSRDHALCRWWDDAQPGL